MKCIVYDFENTLVIDSQYPGFINNDYKIFSCQNCKSHFIDTSSLDTSIYNEIYSLQDKARSYHSYKNHALSIKFKQNPLKYLGQRHSNYHAIYQYLENKKNLKILEVGCGFGYTAYAMKQAGHDVFGIDISEKAINFAKEFFDPKIFQAGKVEDLNTFTKYDLIIATEVIEHLANPNKFVSTLLPLLNKNGKIFITTPNLDFFEEIKPNFTWESEVPPIHTCIMGKNSVLKIANKYQLETRFLDQGSYYGSEEPLLIEFISYKNELIKKLRKSSQNKIGQKNLLNLANIVYPMFYFYKNLRDSSLMRSPVIWGNSLVYKLLGLKESKSLIFEFSRKKDI